MLCHWPTFSNNFYPQSKEVYSFLLTGVQNTPNKSHSLPLQWEHLVPSGCLRLEHNVATAQQLPWSTGPPGMPSMRLQPLQLGTCANDGWAGEGAILPGLCVRQLLSLRVSEAPRSQVLWTPAVGQWHSPCPHVKQGYEFLVAQWILICTYLLKSEVFADTDFF